MQKTLSITFASLLGDFRGNRVGSIDPGTMKITEYPLPAAEARPRRIAVTADDVIWYTDQARISGQLRSED